LCTQDTKQRQTKNENKTQKTKKISNAVRDQKLKMTTDASEG